ncbi:hypothetical protein F4777DRAFT_45119 [Nemania sp. FL0916]|nr:hypothetical protein F4777DRAFT_45119 [Nemania sp. FL0916]
MASLISEHVLQCLDKFQVTTSELDKSSDAFGQKLHDSFALFKLWSGNIGAHRKGRSSLDWRLRDASHLRDLIISLLTDLDSSLLEAQTFWNGNHYNPEFGSERHQDKAPISEHSPGYNTPRKYEEDSSNNELDSSAPALQTQKTGQARQGACDQCWRRKLRCDRKKPQCSNCLRVGIECRFPIPGFSRGSQRGDLKSLEGKIAAPEGVIREHSQSTRVPEDATQARAEALEIAFDIADIIGCLLRLSTATRNPAPHDHFMASGLIDMSHFEEFDVEHVKAKLPQIEPILAIRLGKGISQRRQYFKYREAHHQKLNSGLGLDTDRSEAEAQSTVASSIPTALKGGDGSRPVFGTVEEEAMSNSGNSQTSFASSGPESGQPKWPRLPKHIGDNPFECPFCYMMISVSTTIQWKKHVNADLRPYICLEPDCLNPEQQYAKRHEWLDHLSQKHWIVFKCPYSCQEEDFISPSHLDHHLKQSHPGLSSQRDLSKIFDMCRRTRPWLEKTECPLCHQSLQSKREYARHVGRHQIELAMFALPHNGEENDDEDEEELSYSKDLDGDQNLIKDSSDYQESELDDEQDRGRDSAVDSRDRENSPYRADRSRERGGQIFVAGATSARSGYQVNSSYIGGYYRRGRGRGRGNWDRGRDHPFYDDQDRDAHQFRPRSQEGRFQDTEENDQDSRHLDQHPREGQEDRDPRDRASPRRTSPQPLNDPRASLSRETAKDINRGAIAYAEVRNLNLSSGDNGSPSVQGEAECSSSHISKDLPRDLGDNSWAH